MKDIGIPYNTYVKKYKYKYLALYHSLRDSILDGKINSGFRLPSSRDMGEQYSLSRGTVNQVYEMLAADGYIDTKAGSGTYVTYQSLSQQRKTNHNQPTYQLSTWGGRLPQFHDIRVTDSTMELVADFTIPELPSHDFPFQDWKKAMKQGIENVCDLLQEKEPATQGLPELRKAIASHLMTRRGMTVSENEIVITNGSVHAMAILAQLLIEPGDTVYVEDPCYTRLRNIIQTVGATPAAIPTNKEGKLILEGVTSKIIYMTPTHQYPTGKVMSIEERIHLLNWARETNALVIEDDIDSILRRKGKPIEPLKVLDEDDRVIYLGTFAYTLLTPLRIGYAILPRHFMKHFLNAKHLFEPFTTSIMEQAAIAQFMTNGGYSKHIRRMKKIYHTKNTFLKALFEKQLPDAFTWTGSDTGMYMFGWFNGTEVEYSNFKKRCEHEGVKWDNPVRYFMQSRRPCGLFYFSNVDEVQMEMGVKIMAHCFSGKN